MLFKNKSKKRPGGVYRTLNRNGSLNIIRKGGKLRVTDAYHSVLSISWTTFLLMTFALYLGLNLLFALGYYLCGPDALSSLSQVSNGRRFMDVFFFSVQTLSTIGYGKITPVSLGANLIVTVQALVGVMGLALMTGLFFARFARPTARVIFSSHALVTEHDGVSSLVFRIANERLNQIIEAQIRVVLFRDEVTVEGEKYRNIYDLELERSQTPLFALSLTIVHPITSKSPIFNLTKEELLKSRSEIMVSVTGIDETFAQPIYSRFSYTEPFSSI
jgi:inward rectifier potassium channel